MSKIGALTEVTIHNLQYSSKQIAAAVGKGPIVQLGADGRQTWWVWDIAGMKYTDTGVVAYLGDINEAKTSADRAAASAAAAREAAQEAAQSAADAREHSGSGGGEVEPNELEDYEFEVGQFVNAGAGWNAYKFREPFEGVPSVTCQALDFAGIVQIKNITKEGFLYCLRAAGVSDGSVVPGSVSKSTLYTGAATGTNPQHSAVSVVTNVTLPTVTLPSVGMNTTAAQDKVNYIAIEYGGDR